MDMTIQDKASPNLKEIFKKQQKASLILKKEPISLRKKRLKALKAWIHSNYNRLHEAAFADLRKPSAEFDGVEILYVLNEIKSAINTLSDWAAPQRIDASLLMIGTRSEVVFEPKGVCLIIAPWNYPFCLCVGPLVSALAAGNAAILKPSELSPHISSEIKRMVSEIFDPSIVYVVEGDSTVSTELLKFPFDHIFFTGSTSVGKVVMKAAAENLSSVTLELGGKSPAIVTATARIDDAAQRIAVSKFANAGQTCVAPDYVLVDQQVARSFVERLMHYVTHSFPKSSFPRIVSEKHFNRLEQIQQDAVEKGGYIELSHENERERLSFFPVIMTRVSPDARIMSEEIFGPILPVITFTSLQEAIETVNSRSKPLGLYLFSQSRKEKQKVLRETSSGGACINDCAIQFLHHKLPFGGVSNSGMGKSHDYAGFLAFSNEKAVLRQRNGLTSIKLLYPPYTLRTKKILTGIIRLFYR